MTNRPSFIRRALLPFLALALILTALPSSATSYVSPVDANRQTKPQDRYAMANGCYVVESGATYLARSGETFSATAASAGAAERFFFKATDLGSYLLRDAGSGFLAVTDTPIGTAARATESGHPSTVNGAAHEVPGNTAADVARGDAGRATGRGTAVERAKTASEVADWTIEQTGPDAFTLQLGVTEQYLAIGPGNSLILSDTAGATFGFSQATGCGAFAEIGTQMAGPVATGPSAFAETSGYYDAHLHMMAYEFLGGRARCGKPWNRYGVDKALVDCADHEPNGIGAALEQVLAGGPGSHDTTGWPTFKYWPKNNSLTHEQVYYTWLERAWRGGLRMFTNLLVDNNALCMIYPLKKNSCNEMDGVRLQAQRIHELERYIDAQNGGPGKGWFRIIDNPFQAREVINSGKLAVILGIEVSTPFDCNEIRGIPTCDEAQIDAALDEVYGLGVRQMELTNKFDNALTGVTGDGGTTGVIVNQGNLYETGHYWQMETCPEDAGDHHDKKQMNVHDDAGSPEQLTGRDSLFAGVAKVSGANGVAPIYGEGDHCNSVGLSDLGRYALDGMMERGMIFDPDHMSSKARDAAMTYLEAAGYSGVVSSHGWADDSVYERVYGVGGVITPHAGGSNSFIAKWKSSKAMADDRFPFGIGYGSDINGFSVQGGPRGFNAPNKVTYPFTGFGGVQVSKQVSGSRTYDINLDGVAHYGMYPDWIEDIRKQAEAETLGQGQAILADLARGAEVYLQMWERAMGIAGNACRSDIPDLTPAQVAAVTTGMTSEAVINTLGQPQTRTGTAFTFCSTGSQTTTVVFDGAGLVSGVSPT